MLILVIATVTPREPAREKLSLLAVQAVFVNLTNLVVSINLKQYVRQYLSCHQQRIYNDQDPHHHKHWEQCHIIPYKVRKKEGLFSERRIQMLDFTWYK